jgi:hypothetical protein
MRSIEIGVGGGADNLTIITPAAHQWDRGGRGPRGRGGGRTLRNRGAQARRTAGRAMLTVLQAASCN